MQSFYKILLFLMPLCIRQSWAQITPGSNTQSATFSVPATQSIYLAISDSTLISYVTLQGKPVFTISGINNIVNQYTVTDFKKAFPTSRFRDTRNVYQMNVSSLDLPQALTTSYNLYFPGYAMVPQGQLCYTPSDFSDQWPIRHTKHLKYINAERAWDVTTGNPNVIIGITDTYIDVNHPDLAGQLAQVGPNVLPASDAYHGTAVAGLVAAKTDNGSGSYPYGGYPAIGFKCRIDFSCTYGNDNEMLTISNRSGRRVLNGSWAQGASTPNLDLSGPFNFLGQKIYQEIYENGVFTCIAAGNNKVPGDPWEYAYPASYDYVFSTSSVGHEGCMREESAIPAATIFTATLYRSAFTIQE